MKEIISLKGRGNSGKTRTIKKVFELLKAKYPDATVSIKNKKNDADISVIMDIGQIKIGIESQGDPKSRLEESLEIFLKDKCDIIVCATRTRGMTVEWVRGCSRYNVEWIHQSYVVKEKEEQNNKAKARIIVDMVKEKMRIK